MRHPNIICVNCFWKNNCGMVHSGTIEENCKAKVTKTQLQERGLFPKEVRVDGVRLHGQERKLQSM